MQNKFPLFATLFMLMGVGVLCALGVWQLERLEWKKEILTKIDAAYAQNAEDTLLSPKDLHQPFEYKRGTVRGVYDYTKQIKIGPRVFEKYHGFYLITPLMLDDGKVLLVNRGWIPEAWNPADETGAGETISLVGLIRKPLDENPFTPDNPADKDVWYHIAPHEIAQKFNLDLATDNVLYLEGNPQTGEYPVPIGEKPELANNHLQYAAFWFSMAGILFVIYILRFFKRKK